MIVGNRNRFALEFYFDEFYDDDFIAFGTCHLYIKDFCYGKKSPYHSWFEGVVHGFYEILYDEKKYDNIFSNYSDLEIIQTYWHFIADAPFPTPEKSLEKDNNLFLGVKGVAFNNSFYSLKNISEAHFDDGSNILLFRNDEVVRLIGYRDLGLDENDDVIIEDVNSIIIPRKEFFDIIKNSLDYILSERDKALKKLDNYEEEK